jgi:hypothetical protein
MAKRLFVGALLKQSVDAALHLLIDVVLSKVKRNECPRLAAGLGRRLFDPPDRILADFGGEAAVDERDLTQVVWRV